MKPKIIMTDSYNIITCEYVAHYINDVHFDKFI